MTDDAYLGISNTATASPHPWNQGVSASYSWRSSCHRYIVFVYLPHVPRMQPRKRAFPCFLCDAQPTEKHVVHASLTRWLALTVCPSAAISSSSVRHFLHHSPFSNSVPSQLPTRLSLSTCVLILQTISFLLIHDYWHILDQTFSDRFPRFASHRESLVSIP